MASTSEKTYGSRVYNAEQMATQVATYSGYVPLTPETAIPIYNELIVEIKTANTAVASADSNYSIAVKDRQGKFLKNPNSLTKTLSPILAFVKAKYGKKSAQADEITSLVNEIRGESTKNLKRNDQNEFVSNSHRSYGSQTQYFADIIAILESYKEDYNPTNPTISIENLRLQNLDLIRANTEVTTTFTILNPLQDDRKAKYIILSERAQTIKDTVKSQYGLRSSEYKLIKGYKI